MRAAAVAAAVVAAFVGVMYLRFSGDSVPSPPPGALAGGPQCVVFRTVSDGDDGSDTQATCGPSFESPAAPVSTVWAGSVALPTQATPPDSIGGINVVRLEIGPAVQIPDDWGLIVETCRGDCADTPALTRMYRDSDGHLKTDNLVTLQSLGLSPKSSSNPTGAYFTGLAASPAGSALALSVCVQGSCFFGAEAPDLDAESMIFRSLDGGVTWSELDRRVGIAWVIGMSVEKEALVADVGNDGQVTRIGYKSLPGGGELLPPSGSGYTQPFFATDGAVFWHTDDVNTVVRADGTQWLGSWADPRQMQVALAWDYAFDATGSHALVSGMALAQSGPGANLLLMVRRDGSLGQVFSMPTYMVGKMWLDEAHILAILGPDANPPPRPRAGFAPVLIDLSTRIIHPMRDPFLDPPFFNGINSIIAVQQGPFARVVNTDNTCVNIRAEPLPSAGILDCAAEGVLLRDTGIASGPAGEWLKVVTPAGAEGWANAQYLER